MTPLDAVEAWAAAWRGLDAGALSALFTDDATYVAAISGELIRFKRAFAVAARAWRECRIDDLDAAVDASTERIAVVRATYQFGGRTVSGSEVAYRAAATFVLRREEAEEWRISRFHESHRGGSPAPIT